MERMLDPHVHVDRHSAPRHQYDESGGENSVEDTTVLGMVVVVVGGQVIMAKMEDELMGVVMAIVCILTMKNFMTIIKTRSLMRIPLQIMGCMGSAMIIGGVLIMEIWSIIVVVVIGKTQMWGYKPLYPCG